MALTKTTDRMNSRNVFNVVDFGAQPVDSGARFDCTAGIQAALDAAEPTRGTVFFPNGYYGLSNTLEIPNFVTLMGESSSGVVIDNQNSTNVDGVQWKNKSASTFLFVHMENIVWRGSVTGADIDVGASGEMAGCKFVNVTFELQTDFNFKVNRLLQTTSFINCTFADADYGLFCDAFTTNMNTFVHCNFLNHGWSSIYLRQSEVNNFYGCRFEGGYNALARAVIDVTNTRNLNFNGCYFERTNGTIAESGSNNSITFDNCHFTYPVLGDGYRFVSDGHINFGSNSWTEPSDGAARMLEYGSNFGKLGNNNELVVSDSRQHKQIVSKSITTPTSAAIDLVTFTKANTSGATSNIQMLTGKLILNLYTFESGGFEVSYSREYLVKVRAVGISTISSSISLTDSLDAPRSTTVTVQEKSGASSTSLTIEAALTGFNAATDLGSSWSWSFEYITHSTDVDDILIADVA